MDKLLCYTLSHPEKLDRIGKYLLDILSDSIYRNQSGWVKVSIDAIVELLKANQAQRINLFIDSYLNMVKLLLKSPTHEFQVYGTNAFEKFSEADEDGTAHDRNYDFFIKHFCDYCRDDSKNVVVRKDVRSCGIRGIQSVLRKMMKSQSLSVLLNQHAQIIIPSLLYNMQEDDAEDIVSGTGSAPDSPRYLSEEVIGELLSILTLSQVGLVIAPLLSHCDTRKLWETENAITWAELFMKSVRETYRQNIVKLILEHSEKDQFKNEKAVYIKKGILRVVGEISKIPEKNIMGTIAPELVAIISRGLDEGNIDPDLQDAYINTCGIIVNHLEDFVQIEVLQNMVDRVLKVRHVSPIVLAVSHSFTIIIEESGNESGIIASIVFPLLQVSKARENDLTSDDRLIIGKILLSAIDMNKNISHLSRSGSWGDASGFNVSKSVSTPTSIRRQSLTLIAWIYENMKMEDNTAQNYLVFYQLVGVLLIELGGEVVVQLVKILLALQDEMSNGDLFEHSFKCQTHSCIASCLRLISSFYEPLLAPVERVITERKMSRPQLHPEAMFSGSSDALRRSTASLYSREEPQIDKFLFKRQIICDGLKAAGFDVSGLSDPLGLVVDTPIETSPKVTELDAESVQITIKDQSDDLEKLKKPLISFNDIFNAYRSVPQTIEELNKRDSEQLEKFQKMEFQQIVSQLEQSRKKETEMMKKMLSYSSHLSQSSSFKDYEDTTYPELFVY